MNKSLICTTGKDGKNYYFLDGKRISLVRAKSINPNVICQSKQKPKKKAVYKKTLAKGQSRESIWLLKEALIPIDRYLLIPFRQVGVYPGDKISSINKYGKENLVVADEELNNGLHNFEDLRVGWNEEQWNAFIESVYPVMIMNFKEI